MKKILLLLLFTIASYGQAVFDEGIQITGNANSATATKVNVQETDGKVNTKTINTAFNKNFGLNTGDVVGATTLLNQYSTTPIDWTSTSFSSGQVVFYGGKQWIAKIATVAGDVPAISSKWEEITFEALANKTTTVDQTIIDGSTNAVSGNAVFDGLATKAPISAVHNPVTIGTANGLSLSTQQLSLGLASSGTTGALSGTDWNNFNSKFNTPTGLTTNYLPKWNGSGFGNSLAFDDGTGIVLPKISISSSSGVRFITGSNWDLSSDIEGFSFNESGIATRLKIIKGGRVLINKTDDDLTNQLQVAGTISASPATTANQVPTWGQVQAVASSGSYTPTVSGSTNCVDASGGISTYTRIGNIVTLRLVLIVANFISANTLTSITVNLPINRTLTNVKGIGNGSGITGAEYFSAIAQTNNTNNSAFIQFKPQTTNTGNIILSIQYDVTQ